MSQPTSNNPAAKKQPTQQGLSVEDIIKALRSKPINEVFTEAQIAQLFKGLSNKTVTDIHRNSDMDLRPDAIHHTLGQRPTQASPGSHTHNGGDSALLMDQVTFTGSRGSATAAVLAQILTALATYMGATDATSA